MPQPEVAWTDQDWRSVWKVNADFSAWKPNAKTEHIWRDSFQGKGTAFEGTVGMF